MTEEDFAYRNHVIVADFPYVVNVTFQLDFGLPHMYPVKVSKQKADHERRCVAEVTVFSTQ